jgi:hypothetical protein
MFRFRRRARALEVEFCDGCAEVCTRACRAEAHRDKARTAAFRWIAPVR